MVRINATTCDGGGIGTGFLISPTLVATAGHVVEGAAALSLEMGEDGKGGFTSGVVIGIDRDSDVALIRTARPLSGHLFSFAPESPAVGQEVAAIGFPEGEPMTFTTGTVSGLRRTIQIEGVSRSGLIQTDTAINPGNSDGPATQDPTSASVVRFFAAYFEAINSANYDSVWSMLAPSIRGSSSDGLASGLSTTFDTGLDVKAVTHQPGGKVLAHVSFTSFQVAQKGPDGDTCDNWDLDYLLMPIGQSWQISAVSGYQNGATHSTC